MSFPTSRSAAPWALPCLIAAGYFLFLFYDVGLATQPFWDEKIYVNAARAYVEASKPYPNPEHPPLGKQLLALGIALWGDTPQGWRFFSALCGALSVGLAVSLVHRLTRRPGVAAFVGALFFLDPLLYLHFRLGMLDPPLLFFLLGATFAALKFRESPEPEWRWLYLMGLFLGLGLATKLLALVLAPLLIALALDRCRHQAPVGKTACHAAMSLLLLPATIYIASHAALGYSAKEIWALLLYNFDFHRHHRGSAVMSSRWYEWLYVGKPLWYFWKESEGGLVQAVLGTGNLVLWVGAELLALYALIRMRRNVEVWALGGLVLIQFALYAFKANTFLQYMVLILPFLYILMGIGIGDLFDRYEGRYRRILQIDFACFFLGALLVFWNYLPYLQGRAITRQEFEAVGAIGRPLPMESPKLK